MANAHTVIKYNTTVSRQLVPRLVQKPAPDLNIAGSDLTWVSWTEYLDHATVFGETHLR